MRQFDPIFFTPPSGDTKKPRTLHKGGGGGDGGAAERKAAEDARIAAAVKQLNQVFGVEKVNPEPVNINQFYSPYDSNVGVPEGLELQGSPVVTGGGLNFNPLASGGLTSGLNQTRTGGGQRLFNRNAYNAAVEKAKADADAKNAQAGQGRESLYTKIGDDFRNNAMVDLDKDFESAAREQRFTLARAGLAGGSRDIDSNQELTDRRNQGVLRASNMGIQAANTARSNDDKTRSDLISSIYAGLTGDSAVQQAYEGMRNNSKSAQDEANLASLSGFFDAIKQQQQQAAYTQGFNQFSPQNITQGRGTGRSGAGFNGNVRDF